MCRQTDVVKFVGASLALLVAKMIEIEFLCDKAIDFHAKGLRLSDPLEIFRFAFRIHQLLQSQFCYWGDMRFHPGLVFTLCCRSHLSYSSTFRRKYNWVQWVLPFLYDC
jgi:hypothetical protein